MGKRLIMPTGSLPEKAKALWEQVYQDSKGSDCDEECAAKKAWSAVKNAGWYQEGDSWHKKSELEQFSLTIKRLHVDPQTGKRRWKADTSDTVEDTRNDNMTIDLFKSFVKRIQENELAPEEFRSDFWEGGMPYVSISHYSDQNGKGVPGEPEAVYIDGRFLKARGYFYDSPLGNAAWKSLLEDKENQRPDKTRISIGFLDYAHTHKSNGYKFERKSLDDWCPECLKERFSGKYLGRSFTDGMLVHFALTRVPANKRTDISPDEMFMEELSMTTRKDDAASIIGEELANELSKDEIETMALVEMSETEDAVLVEEAAHSCPKCGKKVNATEEGKCPECGASMDEEYSKEKKEEDKSEVVTASLVVVDLSPVLEAINSLKESMLKDPEITNGYPVLRAEIEKFMGNFNQIVSQKSSADEKLRDIQPFFNEFGESVISFIRESSVDDAVETPEISNGSDASNLVAALSEVMNPIAQKLDMLLSRSSETQTIPQRRSINLPPSLTQNKSLLSEPEKVDPSKPVSIKEFSARSVGIQ